MDGLPANTEMTHMVLQGLTGNSQEEGRLLDPAAALAEGPIEHGAFGLFQGRGKRETAGGVYDSILAALAMSPAINPSQQFYQENHAPVHGFRVPFFQGKISLKRSPHYANLIITVQ